MKQTLSYLEKFQGKLPKIDFFFTLLAALTADIIDPIICLACNSVHCNTEEWRDPSSRRDWGDLTSV